MFGTAPEVLRSEGARCHEAYCSAYYLRDIPGHGVWCIDHWLDAQSCRAPECENPVDDLGYCRPCLLEEHDSEYRPTLHPESSLYQLECSAPYLPEELYVKGDQ